MLHTFVGNPVICGAWVPSLCRGGINVYLVLNQETNMQVVITTCFTRSVEKNKLTCRLTIVLPYLTGLS